MYRLFLSIFFFSLFVTSYANGKNEITTETGELVTLFLWGGVPEDDGPNQVVDRFNTEFLEKGIKVIYKRYNNDEQGNLKLDATLMGGGEIDLFFSYTYEEYARRSEKLGLDLGPFLAKDKFNVKKEMGIDADRKSLVNGKYFGIASKRFNNGFLVNRDMFVNAGLTIPTSWTWEEFVSTAEKLSYGDGLDRVYGAYINTLNQQSSPLEILESELGADHIYRENGTRVDMSNIRYKEVFQNIKDMMDSGSMPKQSDVLNHKISGKALFFKEKLAMLMGTWTIRDIKNLKMYPRDFVTAYIPFPSNNSVDDRYYMVGGPGDMLQINKKTLHPEEAWLFIKWYLKNGIFEMAPYGRMPLNNVEDINLLANNLVQGAENYFDIESILNGYIKPSEFYSVPIFTSSEVVNIIDEEMENMYFGIKDVDQVIEDIETRSNIVLKKSE